jgi:hypothetical protein
MNRGKGGIRRSMGGDEADTEVTAIRRRLHAIFFVTALLVPACTLGKSDEGGRTDAPSSRPPTTAVPAQVSPVHSDVEGLRQRIQLPGGVAHCRWVTRARGDGVLGPTDYTLTAFVELSPAGWNEVSCDGAAPEAPRKIEVDAAEARSLLPGHIVVSLAPAAGGKLLVPITPLAAGCVVSASGFNIGSVGRVGDGLWIEAFTM